MAADHEHDNGWIRMSATSPFAGLWSGSCIIIIQLSTKRVVINLAGGGAINSNVLFVVNSILWESTLQFLTDKVDSKHHSGYEIEAKEYS